MTVQPVRGKRRDAIERGGGEKLRAQRAKEWRDGGRVYGEKSWSVFKDKLLRGCCLPVPDMHHFTVHTILMITRLRTFSLETEHSSN